MVATNDRIHRITTARSDRITRSSRVRLLARQVAAGEYRSTTTRSPTRSCAGRSSTAACGRS